MKWFLYTNIISEKKLVKGVFENNNAIASKNNYLVETSVYQHIHVPVDPERSCWIEVATLLVFVHWKRVEIIDSCRYMTAICSASVQNVWFYGGVVACISLLEKKGSPLMWLCFVLRLKSHSSIFPFFRAWSIKIFKYSWYLRLFIWEYIYWYLPPSLHWAHCK